MESQDKELKETVNGKIQKEFLASLAENNGPGSLHREVMRLYQTILETLVVIEQARETELERVNNLKNNNQ